MTQPQAMDDSGPRTSTRDLVQEEDNRRPALRFFDLVFVRHEVEAGARLMVDDYKQHNPDLPDGKAPFLQFFTGFFQSNPQARAHLTRSATDGDLVYLHCHWKVHPEDRGHAVVDIFRVKDGRIVEHWDVLQEVPATSANENTMF